MKGILSDINIGRIALETGFTKNAMQSKVSGEVFVTSFWLLISECKNTLSSWVSKISQLNIFPISEQGIEHKIRTNGVEFAKCLLKAGLGAEHRCRVRIVAQRLPQEVAGRRRQKAKEDRSAKANHSEEYYQLLGWCIIVTNVPREVLASTQIIKVYACRWRIEILFKAWKSAALNMQEIFKQRNRQNFAELYT
jgi:hypothetical protein